MPSKKNKTLIRNIAIIALTLPLMIFFQNCGSPSVGGDNGSSVGTEIPFSETEALKNTSFFLNYSDSSGLVRSGVLKGSVFTPIQIPNGYDRFVIREVFNDLGKTFYVGSLYSGDVATPVMIDSSNQSVQQLQKPAITNDSVGFRKSFKFQNKVYIFASLGLGGSQIQSGFWIDGIWNPITFTENGGPIQNMKCSDAIVNADQITAICFDFNNKGRIWTNGATSLLTKPTEFSMIFPYRAALIGNDFYVSADCVYNSGQKRACYYKNNVLNFIDPVSSEYSSGSNSEQWGVYNLAGDIYIIGQFTTVDAKTKFGYWKNGIWTDLESPNPDWGVEPVEAYVVGGKLLLLGAYWDAQRLYLGYWYNGKFIQIDSNNDYSKGSMVFVSQ
jgi:hypothetical protein